MAEVSELIEDRARAAEANTAATTRTIQVQILVTLVLAAGLLCGLGWN